MKVRTSQEGQPRTTQLKGGEIQASLKDPHLWLQVQEPPQPARWGRGGAKKMPMITSTGIITRAAAGPW
eukprot:5821327-Heterocapsa_arctica.AAC.1